MRKALSISPWPSVWSQGEGGGSPSESYAIQALCRAGFKVTHLSPAARALPVKEEREGILFVRIKASFERLRPLLKTGLAISYRLPAIVQWSNSVSRWLKRSGGRFDLVLGHSSETVYAMRRAASYLGTPAISRLYGISVPIDRLRRGLRRELCFDLIFLLRHPPDHLVITDDGTCGDEAAGIFGIEPERYHFLRNGYDPSLLSMRCEESSPAYVLTACRLVDWKRVDRVIRIAALCKESLPELQFFILGEGPLRSSIEKLIDRLGVSSTVHLTGMLPRYRMYDLMSGASVVLATQELSNLNNTVLEAMVLGKPVVVLDAGCTRKFIRHGQTGLLYRPYDLEGAARGIERLVREKSFRKDLGRRAKEFSRRILLTWPERLNQEVAIYRRFIRSSSV